MTELKIARTRTEEDVFEQLKTIARAELELRPESIDAIRLDTPIVEGLQLDSLRQVVLLTNIEETFGFEFSLDDRQQLQSLRTVRDLVRWIQHRTGTAS